MQKNQTNHTRIDFENLRNHVGNLGLWVSVIASCSLNLHSVAEEDVDAWEFNAEHPNEVIIGIGGSSIDGDEGQFLQRVGLGDEFWGGLESLKYGSEVGENSFLDVEAKAIPGLEKYLARVRLTKENVGFLEFGYKSSRTFYDATAGYEPLSGYSFQYFDEDLYLDRSELWVAGQWNNGHGTSLDVKYSHHTRNGKKGTTSWADATTPNGTKNIIPGFYDIDEVRDTIEVDFNHVNERLALNLGGVWENNDQDNSRNFRRAPGASADRYFLQREKFETDMYNGHGSISYKINDKAQLNVGSSYTKLDTILNGSRTINGEFSTVFDPNFVRQNRDHGFLDLDGETNIKQWVMNANVEFLASENLQIVPSLRIENYDTDSIADVLETNANGRGVDSFEELQPYGNSYWDDIAGELSIVYRGLPRWILSAELYVASGEGDLQETESDVETSAILLERDTNRERSEQKWSVSAKYYPQAGLNFVFNFYHKEGDNDFDHIVDPTASTGGDRLPAYFEKLNFQTDDGNFRISWKPVQQLSLISRVDFQQSKISQKVQDLALVDSGKMNTFVVSEAFTYVPNDKFMLQGNMSFVRDRLDTPVDELTGVNSQLVPDMNNDYWQVDLSATFQLGTKRSLMLRGFHYESDGYSNNPSVTVPYGYTDEQTSVTATFRQKLDDFTTVSLQYGYYDLNELTSGGRNNYDAHVVYCRWERQF